MVNVVNFREFNISGNIDYSLLAAGLINRTNIGTVPA